MIEPNCFKMDDNYDITGEPGAINRLYQEHESIQILQEKLNLKDFKLLTYENQNLMKNNHIINDSDIVIYGKIS